LLPAPVAKEYLAKRGLMQQTIDEFELGWAPNEPEGLSMHLLNDSAAPQDLIQAGLSMKTERGLMLDASAAASCSRSTTIWAKWSASRGVFAAA